MPPGAEQILDLQGRLQDRGIESCVVGELALNYYNVPRVMLDLELCVPDDRLNEAATAILTSNNNIATSSRYQDWPWKEADIDIYTEYKSAYPRLRCTTASLNYLHVCLLPTSAFDLDPLHENVLKAHTHNGACSKEIIDEVPAADLPKVNFPYLPPFLRGLVRRHVTSGYSDMPAAIMAETLVDGMDLGEEWCKRNMVGESEACIAFALRLVRSKRQRLDYLYPDAPSCHVHDAEEAREVRRIPGRDSVVS